MSYRIQFSSWGMTEFISIIGSFFSSYQKKLRDALGKAYPGSQVHVTNSARGALREVLRIAAVENPQRDTVILPAYVCPSVLDPLRDLGLQVVRAPLDDTLNICAAEVSELIDSRTLAVICVHMYGYPADIEGLQEDCRAAKVLLIDDAAQLGGSLEGGRPLGTYGDVGLVSFAQSKSIVTGINGSGGVLLANSPQWKAKFSGFSHELPRSRHSVLDVIYFLGTYTYKQYFGKTLYYCERLFQRLGLTKAGENSYDLTKISNVEAAIACVQLKSYRKRVLAKKKLLGIYYERLAKNNRAVFPQLDGVNYITRVMMKLPDNIEMTTFRTQLREGGVHTRLGYPGKLRLLEIPCYPSMSINDAENVCLVVRRSMDNWIENRRLVP